MKRTQTLKAIIALSRWNEHVWFVLPLTLLGFLLAWQNNSGGLGLKTFYIIIANILAISFAFMINDVEDAQDDINLAEKSTRNPVSSGRISKNTGLIISLITALISFTFFYFAGGLTAITGLILLVICYFYSVKPVRLKSWPVVDLASHSLMLGGLLVLTSYVAFSNNLGLVWFVVVAAICFSLYGQIYNQIRDYEADKKAKLRNTTIILGRQRAHLLSYLSLFIGSLCILLSLSYGLIPFWLIPIAIIAVLVSLKIKRDKDIRGTNFADATGAYQINGYIVMDVVVFAWFVIFVLKSFFT